VTNILLLGHGEIAFNQLQESAHYPAGPALRFARVKRYRPNKSADQADTIETVRAIFSHQIAYQNPTDSGVCDAKCSERASCVTEPRKFHSCGPRG